MLSNPRTDKLVEELADREAIRDCLMRYCRAIDRRDADLLRTVYWPGAHDHHGIIDASAEEFMAAVIPAVAAMDQTMHSISNVLIRLHDDVAAVESYFLAYHRLPAEDGARRDVLLGGRYLDRMERREHEWRIAERTVLYDWYTDAPSQPWRNGAFGMDFATNSCPEDASYSLFDEIERSRG